MNDSHVQKGFSLIELMVTMVVALVVLAGMTSLFVSQTQTARVLNLKSDVMADLFLASQIMQTELRNSSKVCWNVADSALRYEPFGSLTVLTTACLSDQYTGAFSLRPVNATHPSPWINWKKSGNVQGQELIRNMQAATGITVIPNVNTIANMVTVKKIILTSEYVDKDQNIKNIKLSVKVWPRNM